MMNSTKEKIEAIKKNGYQLDFANVFNHAFENYKKIALYAGLVLFVFSILISILIAGGVITTLGIEMLTEGIKPENLEPKNFTDLSLTYYIIGLVLFSCLISPFQAGFLKMADCGERGSEFHVSTIFEYYKAPFLKEIFIATFLISSISIVQSTLLSKVGYEIIGTLITYSLSFLTLLTIPLIVFGNLKAVDAIKSSITIVSKQPLTLLGLIIVAIIGVLVGIFGCCIGLFFTIPFMYSMTYAIYSSIVGIDYENELEEIG